MQKFNGVERIMIGLLEKAHHPLIRGGLLVLATALTLVSCAPISSLGASRSDSRGEIHMPTETHSIELPDLGPAPELTNEIWLNTKAPLCIADLNGKVILLDFWTFG